jgi:hypothetical protein
LNFDIMTVDNLNFDIMPVGNLEFVKKTWHLIKLLLAG